MWLFKLKFDFLLCSFFSSCFTSREKKGKQRSRSFKRDIFYYSKYFEKYFK